MAGPKSVYAAECKSQGYIGCNFDIDEDLTDRLPENWREFNEVYIPVWLAKHPGKARVSAGLSCGQLWTITKGLKQDDIILCPDGSGRYMVGLITAGYSYYAGTALPHRRAVKWLASIVDRSDMSESLKNSTGSIGTVCNITRYANEIEKLIGGESSMILSSGEEKIEDIVEFAFEKYLEEFLVQNWNQTEIGKMYDIYQDGDLTGQQFITDTGRIDILAISKNRRELLVVELKKGRASDAVVGQIQRYMGDVMETLAEPGQIVKGVIIAMEDDIRIRRALTVTQNIEFYKYQISFKLVK